MTVQMLVAFRIPTGAMLAALLAAASVAFALSALSNEGPVREGDALVREIRASSAPLLASDVAGFIERRRREGHSDADVLAAWLAQFPKDDREEMRDWLDYHHARVGTTAAGSWVETSSGPGADGWFRIEVDRRAGHVEPTCGGEPAPGCVSGRWRLDEFGLVPEFLLGENDGQ